MSGNCQKRGCEKAATNTLRFTNAIWGNVDTDHPVQLCEKHAEEVENRFSKTDVKAVKGVARSCNLRRTKPDDPSFQIFCERVGVKAQQDAPASLLLLPIHSDRVQLL